MEVCQLFCPNCGGAITIPQDADVLTCEFCASSLQVHRSEGRIMLDIGEVVSQAVSQSGEQTREAIHEGTYVTREELRRVQASQALSNLRLMRANLQSEIRELERKGWSLGMHLERNKLRAQDAELQAEMEELRRILEPEQAVLAAKPAPSARSNAGCLTWLMWLTLWPVLFPAKLWRGNRNDKIFALVWVFTMWPLLFTFCAGFAGADLDAQPSSPSSSTKTVVQKTSSGGTKDVAPTHTPISVRSVATSAPTRTPRPTNTPRPTSTEVKILRGTVQSGANLRAGPGTNYDVVGAADSGKAVEITGCNQGCDWYQLADGAWIAAFLLNVDSMPPKKPATPKPSPTKARSPGEIPGLDPAYLKTQLTRELGFRCSDEHGVLYYTTTCKQQGATYEVVVVQYSRSRQYVDFVNTSVAQFGAASDKLAVEYMANIAGIRYEGADTAAAQQWVTTIVPSIRQNGHEETTRIGGVKFELFGAPSGRFMNIGHLVDP